MFIERLSNERDIFDIKKYSANLLQRADILFAKDKTEFLEKWNDYFETDFQVNEINNAENIFKETGFQLSTDYPGVVYGSLYHNNELIQSCDNLPSHQMDNIYGSWKLELQPTLLKDSVTLCLGDSFDASPMDFWKIREKCDRQWCLFTPDNAENIFLRCKTSPSNTISYVEAHCYKTIQATDIKAIHVNSFNDELRVKKTLSHHKENVSHIEIVTPQKK